MVVAGVEEAAVGCGEVVDGCARRARARATNQRWLEGGLVEREQPVGTVGVVLEIAVELGRAVLPRAQQTAVGRAQVFESESGVALGRATVVVAAERPRRLGEGRQHEAVPGGEHLLVARRPHAPLARREEARASGVEPARDLVGLETALGSELLRCLHEREDRAPLEVAGPRDAVGGHEEAGLVTLRGAVRRLIARFVARLAACHVERRAHLLGSPHEEGALASLRVGVLRRVEAAAASVISRSNVVERLGDDPPVALAPR